MMAYSCSPPLWPVAHSMEKSHQFAILLLLIHHVVKYISLEIQCNRLHDNDNDLQTLFLSSSCDNHSSNVSRLVADFE